MGCKYLFLDNPIVELKKKEVGGGDTIVRNCFQNSYFHNFVEPRFNHEGGWNINGIGILEF